MPSAQSHQPRLGFHEEPSAQTFMLAFPRAFRVESPITDHFLRDFVSNLKKYKAVQFFHAYEDRDKEIVISWVILFFKLNYYKFWWSQTWPELITNV